MNTSRCSLHVALIAALAAVGLVGLSVNAQGCPGKKAQDSGSYWVDSTDRNGDSQAIRPESDQKTSDAGIVLPSDHSSTGEKTWQMAAIGLAILAGSSLSFLGYRTWVSRKSTPVTPAIHPELDHPELQLTNLPKEAFPQLSYSDFNSPDWQPELVSTR
ncbi:MAG: hypothetical protein NW224_07385 [Leptolyngbyaceae cyanobacterium bins.302]|nr:hypothetical protein [Leptolyngbyaceae cyanobacterium bins.302]